METSLNENRCYLLVVLIMLLASYLIANPEGTIINCYSVGVVTGPTETAIIKGGLIAENSGVVTSSFWDSQTSLQLNSAGGTSNTTSEMKTQSTFLDWDFTEIWQMVTHINEGYPSFQWQNSTQINNHFTPVWAGNGLQHMNFYVNSATVDNTHLSIGDEIGVFDDQYCVGSFKIQSNSGNVYSFVASLDDTTTPVIDGYSVGHPISFKLYKTSTNTEFSGSQLSTTYLSGTAIFNIGATDVVSISAISSITQNITLSNGWNMMSINTIPTNLTVNSVFSPLVNSNQLVKIMNESGQAFEYLSVLSQWINNIGLIETTEGYLVKVNANTQLSIEGLAVTTLLSIPLTNGWNMMSYPYQNSQAALPLVQTLINNNQLVKIMNESGQAIENVPVIGWINNINNFVPGEGYSIKVNQNTSLIYPSQRNTNEIALVNQEVNKQNSSETIHFNKVWSGNGLKHHNFYILANDYLKSILRAGDEIAIFDGNNCVATQIVEGNETYYSLNASIKEEDSSTINGYTLGNSFTIRIYNYSSEYSNVPFELISGPAVFEIGGSSAIRIDNVLANNDITTPKLTEIKSIYPNPFNPTTTIQYSLNKSEYVEIEIYNVKGQKVNTLVSEQQNAGHYQVTWQGKDSNQNAVSSGVYFCKMKTADKQITKKMMMIK